VAPRVTLRAALASFDVHGISDDQPDSPGDQGYVATTNDRSHRRSGDVRLELALPRQSQLTLGAAVERKWQEQGTRSNVGDDFPPPATRRSTGGYAQLLLEPAGGTLALGGRFEHNEQFGDFWTYRAAASRHLARSTRLRASIGTAFKEPTFLETEGSGYVIGNRALKPEHALSGEVGVEQEIGRHASVGATWFANSFRDLIDYTYSATEPNYFNVARTRARGLELEGRVALPSGWRADAAFTHLETRVVDAGLGTGATAVFAAGSRLLRRPMRTLDVGLGYRAAEHGIELRALHVGRRDDAYYPPDFSDPQRVSLAPYTRVDLSADRRLLALGTRQALTLTLRVENLFDTRYTEAAGFNYDFARTDDESIRRTGFRGAERRLLAGVRVAF
jgi:vitamin B12 transporter